MLILIAKLILSNLGLLFNFIGSILIAFSVFAHPYDGSVMHKGKERPIACIKSRTSFWVGVIIMILGFLISIVYSIAKSVCDYL